MVLEDFLQNYDLFNISIAYFIVLLYSTTKPYKSLIHYDNDIICWFFISCPKGNNMGCTGLQFCTH